MNRMFRGQLEVRYVIDSEECYTVIPEKKQMRKKNILLHCQ